MNRTGYKLLPLMVSVKRIKSTRLKLEINHVKRLVDIVLSLFGIIMVSPFLPFIALLIKLDSKGPVFYLSDRVGRNLKSFRMWKFRTMIDTPIEVGESVSPQFDPRVTPVGRLLRRTKINELPQLVNVLKGEMTFVGPRPEAPDLAELYPEEAKRVFSVQPGLVGPASIIGRNEEEVYPPGVDAKKYYIENILPNKNKIDLEYIDNQSLLNDMKYIFAGVKETLVGTVSKKHIHDNWSQICLLICDAFLMTCSYLCASMLYSWRLSVEVSWAVALFTVPIVILTRLAWNIYFSMYNSLIRYISYHDIAGVLKGVSAGSVFLLINSYALHWIHYPGGIAVIDWGCLIIILSGLRLMLRLYWDTKHRKYDQRGTHRILIYGVCDEGNAACRAVTSDRFFPFEIVGFIDDKPSNFGKTVNGKKVLGDRHHISALARLYRVEEVLVAHPAMHGDKLSEIKAICEKANLKCRAWNPVEDVDSNRPTIQARDLNLAELLPLNQFHADPAAVRRILTDKTVLMNGSGGAVGLELCRRTLQLGCRRLIILDRYESYLNELVAALMKESSRAELVPVIVDGEETASLEEVFRIYFPNVVIHAGMRKYTPFLGVDLCDIGRINYLRTFNLAKAASKFHCEWFVMISALMSLTGRNLVTDSLRVAEASVEQFLSGSNTRLIVSRICDVIENRGGIVSIIEHQIRNQKTLTLPSADAEACFISKDYAAEFILHGLVEAERTGLDEKAQSFACDAGSPIRLITLGERLARFYGLTLGSDVAVEYTGANADQVSDQSSPSLSTIGQPGTNTSEHTHAEMKAFFRDFVPDHNAKRHPRDWKEWTQRAITACEPIS